MLYVPTELRNVLLEFQTICIRCQESLVNSMHPCKRTMISRHYFTMYYSNNTINIIIIINYIIYTGGEECGRQVQPSLWLHYSVNVKKTPPPFFDHSFYSACNEACRARFGIDLNNGVTHTNWSIVYKYLKNSVSI